MDVSSSGEIRTQRDDTDASVFAVCQHRTVPGDDDMCTGCNRTFQNSVVGLVGKHGQRFGRLDEFTYLGEKDGNARESLAIMGKLPGENGEELVENGLGKGERILSRNYSAERLVASPARKRKGRHQNVRVEYDPHACKYRCKSSSVRIPCSLAR